MTQTAEIKHEGSAITGMVYQNIPSRPDIPFHRGKSDWRAERICELVDMKGKTVLDLGCSVGTMSAIFKSKGAYKVTGIDYDAGAISLAVKTYPAVEFIRSVIATEWLRTQGRWDIVIWTSQFMWMVKQHGMEYALEFLFELSKKCDTLVFETAGIGDGMAPLNISQEEIIQMLIKNTCFQDIRDYGPWGDEWTTRNVFVCKNPKLKWESLLSTVERIDRKYVLKRYDATSDRAKEIFSREAEFLRMVRIHPNFANYFSINMERFEIKIDYAGIPALWIPEKDLTAILGMLRDEKIIHRDIQPSNILWNGKNCVLIDFAYAVQPGELTNYHYDLGGEFRCPHGFNDEYSLRKTQAYLMQKELSRG